MRRLRLEHGRPQVFPARRVRRDVFYGNATSGALLLDKLGSPRPESESEVLGDIFHREHAVLLFPCKPRQERHLRLTPGASPVAVLGVADQNAAGTVRPSGMSGTMVTPWSSMSLARMSAPDLVGMACSFGEPHAAPFSITSAVQALRLFPLAAAAMAALAWTSGRTRIISFPE